MLFEGDTLVQENDSQKLIYGLINVLYEPNLNLLSIDTYSDVWMPIGLYDDVLQIELGIINAKRLKEGLEQISQLKFIKRITPSKNECFHDYIAYQIGFDLFYKRSIENIKGLSKDDYSKVAPFILSI